MYEDYKKEYIKKMKTFFERTSDCNLEGIPSFHIPTVGSLYGTTSPKLAIFGMEARGQGYLKETKDIFEKDENKGFEHVTRKEFSELDFADWKICYFNDFILQLLAKLYHIDYDDLITNEKYSSVLKSFIWGNINSLERFEITAEGNEVDSKTWEKVKEQSEEIFDSADIILKTCTPNVIIILHWANNERWFPEKYNVDSGKMDVITDRFWYEHMEETDTHVLWLDHPKLIAVHPGFKETIRLIHECLKELDITFIN